MTGTEQPSAMIRRAARQVERGSSAPILSSKIEDTLAHLNNVGDVGCAADDVAGPILDFVQRVHRREIRVRIGKELMLVHANIRAQRKLGFQAFVDVVCRDMDAVD